jgi:lauroyl/myristoyl acyltransferase
MVGSDGLPVTAERRPLMHDAPATVVPPHAHWHTHSWNSPGADRLAAAFGWLPRPVRLAIARRVGAMVSRAFPAERRMIERSLAIMTGASGAALDMLTTAVFRDFAMCFSDLVSTNRATPERVGRYVNPRHGRDDVDAISGGLVSVTAHVGNWELAGRLMARTSARRTNVVVAPGELPQLGQWVRRDGAGVRFIARASPRVGLELFAALRRGEVVALQGDRAIGTRGDVAIPFFGRPALFPLGPFILARAAGVPVVPAFCVLEPDCRYSIRVAPPITVKEGDEEAAAATWVRVLESLLRDYPTQWFNFFDVWHPGSTMRT